VTARKDGGVVTVRIWWLRCSDVKVQIRGCCCDCSGESGGFSSPLVGVGADGAREVRCGEDGGGGTVDSNQARRCGMGDLIRCCVNGATRCCRGG